MSNNELKKKFKLAALLMELHGANPFKLRAYSGVVMEIEKHTEPLANKPSADLEQLGISKNMAAKIEEIARTGTFAELAELEKSTPAGVIAMTQINGIGAKKIRMLWQELQVETLDALQQACETGKVAGLKGFGQKTQQQIMDQIRFLQKNASKLRYDQAEAHALQLMDYLKGETKGLRLELCGQLRRCLEVAEKIELLATAEHRPQVRQLLAELPEISYHEQQSGPFSWRGQITDNGMPVEIHFAPAATFESQWLLLSAAPDHLAQVAATGNSLRTLALSGQHATETAVYEAAGLPWIAPELREGTFEVEAAKNGKLPQLVRMKDIKGVFHAHSVYSDGQNSLEEMARACMERGYEYLGITDHSKSSFYANGLSEDRIKKQHEEIDKLNRKLAPFRIFKGIESDILNNGYLDYSNEVLASFDFIVSSVHSNLKMDAETATKRVLTAIENPYTTMLGHMTGRLLLKREGFPADHEAVIEACAKHQVIIEINANPRRLDIDWRWVRQATEAGVLISINPDAHVTSGLDDTRYGLLVGRKGGLTAAQTFNTRSLAEVEKWLGERRRK